MNYLKLFNNNSEYEEYKQSGMILPIVSHCINEAVVHYNEYFPPHEYVEIGGVKWATMNVGANSATDYGLYFAWGETQGYKERQIGTDKQFNSNDYKWGSRFPYTKYNPTDGKKVLDAKDDAVVANWGNGWRMPTSEEFLSLYTYANYESVTNYNDSGVDGVLFTDKNDSTKKLFFPSCGLAANGSLQYKNVACEYASNSINGNDYNHSWCIDFGVETTVSMFRHTGLTVRGVLDN